MNIMVYTARGTGSTLLCNLIKQIVISNGQFIKIQRKRFESKPGYYLKKCHLWSSVEPHITSADLVFGAKRDFRDAYASTQRRFRDHMAFFDEAESLYASEIVFDYIFRYERYQANPDNVIREIADKLSLNYYDVKEKVQHRENSLIPIAENHIGAGTHAHYWNNVPAELLKRAHTLNKKHYPEIL